MMSDTFLMCAASASERVLAEPFWKAPRSPERSFRWLWALTGHGDTSTDSLAGFLTGPFSSPLVTMAKKKHAPYFQNGLISLRKPPIATWCTSSNFPMSSWWIMDSCPSWGNTLWHPDFDRINNQKRKERNGWAQTLIICSCWRAFTRFSRKKRRQFRAQGSGFSQVSEVHILSNFVFPL